MQGIRRTFFIQRGGAVRLCRGTAGEEAQTGVGRRAASAATAAVGHLSVFAGPEVAAGEPVAADERVVCSRRRGRRLVDGPSPVVRDADRVHDVTAATATATVTADAADDRCRAAIHATVRERLGQPRLVHGQQGVAIADAVAAAPDAPAELAARHTRLPDARRPADPVRAVSPPSPSPPPAPPGAPAVPAAGERCGFRRRRRWRRLPLPLSGRVERAESARRVHVIGRRVAVRQPRQHEQFARLQVAAVSDQQEERQDALRVQRVPQDVRPALQPEGTPEDALGREAVQVQDVRQELHATRPPAEAQLRAHRYVVPSCFSLNHNDNDHVVNDNNYAVENMRMINE